MIKNNVRHFYVKTACVFFMCLLLSLQVSAQNVKIQYQETPIKTVLKDVSRQIGYNFVYSNLLDGMENKISINIDVSASDIKVILDTIFAGTNIVYEIKGKQVALMDSKIKKGTINPQKTQKRTIIGNILDDTGQPLVYVVVKNENSGSYVMSDLDGKYSIEANDEDILSFSLIGMEQYSATIGKRSMLNITMKTEAIALQDVVVTGYYTISKERATGAYAIVNSELIKQKPTSKISNILNGLVPGMAVQNSPVDGQTRFVIRGYGTLQDNQQDRDPLIVVDGFPINGFSDNTESPLSNIKDPFSTINPNDVESITVLKDAAATSIYGARAANGVIVITTKKGKEGTKLDISIDAYTSISSKPDLDYAFNMASAKNQFRYLELMQNYDPISLSGYADPYTIPSARINYMSEAYSMLFERDERGAMSAQDYESRKQQLIGFANQGLWKKNLNKYIFRNSITQQYNLALRGASDKINYSFSASYDGEDTYVKGNSSNRILLNVQSTAKLTKNLSLNVNINTSFAKRNNNGTDIPTLKTYISPWSRLVDEKGDFVHVPTSETVYYPVLMSEYEGKTPASWLYNPVTDRKYNDISSDNVNYRVQGGLDYRTEWGLNLSAKGQYEYRRFDSKIMYDAKSFFVRNNYNICSELNEETQKYVSYFPAGGIFTDSGDKYQGYNLRAQADYNKRIKSHNISFIAGTEIISSTTTNIPDVSRYGFNKNTYSVLTTPDYITQRPNIFDVPDFMPFDKLGTLYEYQERYFSAYANASYTYNDKLSFTVSFRTDATNYQAEEVRDKFSPFWSIGGSYLLSKEKFLQNTSWLDMLKIRASVGIAGVSAGKKDNSTVTTLSTFPGSVIYTDNQPYATISIRGNPTLTWEKSRTVNAGLDFALFKNALSGSIDYYNRFSYDVLAKATVPVISQGTTTSVFNNAEIRNTGVEFSLNSNLQIVNDLWWNGNLNLSYNNNKVVKYNVKSSTSVSSIDVLQGYPLNSIAVLKPKGYTKEGAIILQGKDGKEEVITDMTSSHINDQIDRRNGKSIDDLNYTYYLGTRFPKYEMGFSNSFNFRGITLSFMITGRFDYYVAREDIFNLTVASQPSASKHLDKSFKVYDQGYANQKSYSAFPLYNDENASLFNSAFSYMYSAQFKFRDNYVRGDHIRLQEVYLGYDLPKSLLLKQKIFSGINVYAQATNLGIIYSVCKDFDPEYVLGTIKPMRTITIGLKLNFQ